MWRIAGIKYLPAFLSMNSPRFSNSPGRATKWNYCHETSRIIEKRWRNGRHSRRWGGCCFQSPEAGNFTRFARAEMVTPWPKNFPGLGTGAERLAQRIQRAPTTKFQSRYLQQANSYRHLSHMTLLQTVPPISITAQNISGEVNRKRSISSRLSLLI